MACSSGQNNAETLEGFHEVNLASPTTPDLQVRSELQPFPLAPCMLHVSGGPLS